MRLLAAPRLSAVALLDELGDLLDVRLVHDCGAGQEVISFEQPVLNVVRQQKNWHVPAPELLLINGEGLFAVTDCCESLSHNVISCQDQVIAVAIRFGR